MNATLPRPVTDGQIKFIADLLRDIAPLDGTDFAATRFELYKSMHAEGKLTFATASSVIDELKDLRKSLRAAQTPADMPKQRTSAPEVPEGRYAVKNNDDDWAFYRVSAKGFLSVFRSDDEISLPRAAVVVIKRKIVEMGLEASQTAFGVHSTFCYECGRRLTDETSLALGIGPKCRGEQ